MAQKRAGLTKKRWYQKGWLWAFAAVIVILGIYGAAADDVDTPHTPEVEVVHVGAPQSIPEEPRTEPEEESSLPGRQGPAQPHRSLISSATLTYVIDGDTIETSQGRVRIIGIDTPERNECGYQEAKDAVEQLLPRGSKLTLTHPDGTDATDKYDRMLRYVTTADDTDVGLSLIEEGLAVARYDSRDGYARHPKEEQYHREMLGHLRDGRVITPACEGQRRPPSVDEFEGEWWQQYRSCSQLKKNTMGHPKGPFDVNNPAEKAIYDWFAYGTGYNGDGDGDGLACE